MRAAPSATQLQALSDAVKHMDDLLLAEIVVLYHDTGPAALARPFSDLFLSSRYVDFYDFKILRRLYACLLVVAGRLQDWREPPRCRGRGAASTSHRRSH